MILAGITLGATLLYTDALPGSVSPSLKRIENCTSAATVSGVWLKAHSTTNKLFLTRTETGSDSVDGALMEGAGLAGMIGRSEIYSEDTELSYDRNVEFTGVVYLREASSVEAIIAGTVNYAYYQVRYKRRLWMLDITAFEIPPFDLCL
ncbi:MAG: hypothetical protein CL583_18035 [Alteromonadaceae bacterium]|nr:hypothetical protein [Alteromonadaceae bacterium]|tara:strand:- start:755 stop:1201 length:447 start_codon:yes stop_codon:yes gene_type:complete